jgi:RNA polymerase sigma-70 factor (ECF subfamily)
MNGVDGKSNEAIIRSVLGGDAEAYGRLVERYRGRLFGLAFHLCGDYDAAGDLTQEALIAAYDSLDRIRDPKSFPSWAASILRNKFRNQKRKRQAPTVSLDQMMEAGFDPPAPDCPPGFSDEQCRQVMQCVQSLPEKPREALILRYVEDLSYKEMAAFLGVPVTTVTMRLAHARRSLIQKAKEDGLL